MAYRKWQRDNEGWDDQSRYTDEFTYLVGDKPKFNWKMRQSCLRRGDTGCERNPTCLKDKHHQGSCTFYKERMTTYEQEQALADARRIEEERLAGLNRFDEW